MTPLSALLYNAALLLALVWFFDLVTSRQRQEGRWKTQVMAGLMVGALGVGVVATAYVVEPGIIFDTRSVLLSISGLFLGLVPTAIAAGCIALYRLVLGGVATGPGILVILATAGLGLLWRRYRRRPLSSLKWGELYGFGLGVHVVMLALLGLTLPRPQAERVLQQIAWPVMLIYPLATAALGRLMVERLRRQQTARSLEESEARLRQLVNSLPVAMVVTRVPEYRIEFLNPRAAELFRLAPEQAVGRPTLDFYVHKPDARSIRVELERHGRAHRPVIRFQRADGQPFWAELSTVLLHDAAGRVALAAVHDISERQQAEEALRRSEENYREIYNAAHDAILLHDAESGRLLDVNAAMLRLFGYTTKEEALAAGPADLWAGEPPHTEAEFLARLHRARSEGPQLFEWPARRKNGERVWVEAALRSTSIGGTGRVLAVLRDITERQRSEAALREGERQLSTLLSNLPGMAYRRRPDDRWTLEFVSPGAFGLTGYPPEELLNNHRRALADLIHPEDRVRVSAEIAPALEQHLPFILNYRLLRASGDVCWVWEQGGGVYDEAGRLVAVEGLILDDTVRHAAAAELERREAHYRSLIENTSDLITVLSQDGTVCYQSPSSERVLGYPPDQLLGRNLFEFVHPEDAFLVREGLQRALAGNPTPTQVECRVRSQGGEWRTLKALGRLLPAEGGPPRVVVNARDITQERRLEEQFRQMQKMEAIGRLAGGVAHDFNNILAVIMMQAEVTGQISGLPERVREGLRQISAAAERAANLARQLLVFSRRQVLQPRLVDLNDIIANLVKMMHRLIGEDIKVEVQPHPQPLRIHADPGMIEQVLMNLAVNARDAMPGGGRLLIQTAEVTVDETYRADHPEARPGRFACLTVTDSGGGIAAEVLPHIFEPFFTTKETGKGTGLGLATVFGIVQQHRGWVEVQSAAGEGTTFRVYLPLTSEAAPAKAPAPAPPGRTRGGTETVLLAEDEAGVRALIRTLLERQGYTVLEAANGPEALEYWQAHKAEVKLLLTDLVMPGGMTGQQLARRLREERPQLKVVYLSGYSAQIAGRHPGLQAGERFLGKPFTAPQLLEIVRDALDQ